MKSVRNRLVQRLTTFAALSLAVCLIGARPFTPGLTYKVRMTMTMPPMPGMNAGDLIIVGHGVAANGRSRIDIDSGGGGPMAPFGPGDYILSLDSGRTVIVMPATKSYIDGFTMGGGMPPEIMAQASLSGVSVNVEKLGAGETIDGRATEKFRLTSQYTLSIMGNSIGMGSEAEILTAQLPTKISNAFGGGLPKAMATGPFSELYTKMLDAQKQMPGTALRVNNVMTITGPMSMNMSQTMQILDVKNADIDEKQFQVPDGFTARPPGT
jgi:hypothetical protein